MKKNPVAAGHEKAPGGFKLSIRGLYDSRRGVGLSSMVVSLQSHTLRSARSSGLSLVRCVLGIAHVRFSQYFAVRLVSCFQTSLTD
jgi:hypothetical protein